jgi:hypothetical protein
MKSLATLLLFSDELAVRPQPGFAGFAEVLEFLVALPTPEEILASKSLSKTEISGYRMSKTYVPAQLRRRVVV